MPCALKSSLYVCSLVLVTVIVLNSSVTGMELLFADDLQKHGQTATFTEDESYRDMFVVSEANFTEKVIGSKDPWVVIFHDGSVLKAWKTMSVSVRGFVWVGLVNKNTEWGLMSDTMGISGAKIPAARVYPAGDPARKLSKFRDVSGPTEAKLAAVKSIPDVSQRVNSKNLKEFLADCYTSEPSRFPLVYLTIETETPSLIKGLAVRFQKYFHLGVLSNPSTEDLGVLGADATFLDFPSILTMIGRQEGSVMKMSAVPYRSETHGVINYPNILKYLFAINENFRYKLPGRNLSNQKQAALMEDIVELEQERFNFVQETETKLSETKKEL